MLVPFLFLNAALYMLVRYLNVLLRLENNVKAYTAETLWMQACLNLLFLLPGFFTHRTWVFIAAAVASFGCVAVAFWFKAKAPLKAPALPYKTVYRQMVPYSIALAPAAVLTPLFQSVALSFLASYSGATGQGAVLVRLPAFAAGHDGAGRVFDLLGAVCVRALPHRAGAHRAASTTCSTF